MIRSLASLSWPWLPTPSAGLVRQVAGSGSGRAARGPPRDALRACDAAAPAPAARGASCGPMLPLL